MRCWSSGVECNSVMPYHSSNSCASMTPRPFLDRLHAEFFPTVKTDPFRPEESPLNLRAYRQARRVQVEVMHRGILGNKTAILRSGPLRSKSVPQPTTNRN
jgi:hypothetical protein